MADSPATIRRAETGDRDAITALWLQLLEEQSELEERFRASGDAAERWENDFPEWIRDETRRVFVAEHEEGLAGFISAHRWTPAPIYAISEEVYIDELFVRPEQRRQGFGKRLVEAVEAWAANVGAERLRLGVLAANEGGNAFWERLGARPLSTTLVIDVEGTSSPPDQPEHESHVGF